MSLGTPVVESPPLAEGPPPVEVHMTGRIRNEIRSSPDRAVIALDHGPMKLDISWAGRRAAWVAVPRGRTPARWRGHLPGAWKGPLSGPALVRPLPTNCSTLLGPASSSCATFFPPATALAGCLAAPASNSYAPQESRHP
jgi:hypothetical protein